ncbi:MAG: hypothetical protein ABIF18_00055 [archaeon]
MEKQYNRREFLKYTTMVTTGLVESLVVPETLYATTNEDLRYSYPTPKTREDLKNIPEKDLFARMIFGEGRGCPTIQERILIGQTAPNRLNDGKIYTGKNSLREVLLKQNKRKERLDDQYDCFCDTIPKIRENFHATLDPLKYEPREWKKSLIIASILLYANFNQFNKGQTIYVTKKLIKKWERKGTSPLWFRKCKKTKGYIQNDHLFRHEFYKEAV